MLACFMILLVGCSSNTAKEAAKSETKTETSFPAGNTETQSQEETSTEQESTVVQEKTPNTTDESRKVDESKAISNVQSKPADEKSSEKQKSEPSKQTNTPTVSEKHTEKSKEPTSAIPKTAEKPKEPKPTEPPKQTFDVSEYVSYAKSYAQSIGLELDSTATECWDNPITANSRRTGIKDDIKSRLNRYKNAEGFTAVWVWAEKVSDTVYGKLMICQCGKRFNLRYHSRDDRTDGVDYQCYSTVNQGSKAERERQGLSTEGVCDSPFIQGWKLEMMAEKIFEKYIENVSKVMDLSYSMLEKHIADEEEIPDNSDVIERKEQEYEKLQKKKENLIEMRVEGDIDKDLFREKKKEIELQLSKLENEIALLKPVDIKQTTEDYTEKLALLRKQLKKYTGFEYSVIPESVVEDFIEKIWVSKDEFRWYLRTGKEANSEFNIDDHIKIGEFTITLEDAKKYLYSFSTRRRVYKWKDLNVSVWI